MKKIKATTINPKDRVICVTVHGAHEFYYQPVASKERIFLYATKDSSGSIFAYFRDRGRNLADRGFSLTIKELYEELIASYEADESLLQRKREEDKDTFAMTIMGIVYTEKKDAGSAVIDLCSQMGTADEQETQIGEYLGFTMALSFSAIEKEYLLSLKGNGVYLTHLGQDPSGIIIRINNALDTIPKSLAEAREKLEETREQLEVASIEVKKIFPREEEYQEKQRRLSELDAKLSLDGPMITDKERSCQVAEKQERYLPGKTKAI